jgi:metal-responsive CopG/Arc/MetJ family transcriptional regulator
MVRKTVFIPDDLHRRVEEHGGLGDSYSAIVQDALRDYLDAQDEVEERDQTGSTPVDAD